MYITYAIRSLSRNYTYIGLSGNLDRRLSDHNKGYNRTTRPYRPFHLIYSKEFNFRQGARDHEKYLKTTAGRKFLRTLK